MDSLQSSLYVGGFEPGPRSLDIIVCFFCFISIPGADTSQFFPSRVKILLTLLTLGKTGKHRCFNFSIRSWISAHAISGFTPFTQKKAVLFGVLLDAMLNHRQYGELKLRGK
jgi:hypothetical protein